MIKLIANIWLGLIAAALIFFGIAIIVKTFWYADWQHGCAILLVMLSASLVLWAILETWKMIL